MVTETSRQAFINLLNEGRITPMQEIVYDLFFEFPDSSDYEIALKIGKPINTITPRRGELVELGLLKKIGQKLNPVTGMMNDTWRCGKPDPKEYTGLSHTKFETTLKNIKEANEFQKMRFHQLLCKELKLP